MCSLLFGYLSAGSLWNFTRVPRAPQPPSEITTVRQRWIAQDQRQLDNVRVLQMSAGVAYGVLFVGFVLLVLRKGPARKVATAGILLVALVTLAGGWNRSSVLNGIISHIQADLAGGQLRDGDARDGQNGITAISQRLKINVGMTMLTLVVYGFFARLLWSKRMERHLAGDAQAQ